MLSHMRTTIILPDSLYEQVKRTAHDADQTVTSLVEEALRRELDRRLASGKTPKNVILPRPFDPGPGRGGVNAGVDITNNAELQDLMDEGLPTEKLR